MFSDRKLRTFLEGLFKGGRMPTWKEAVQKYESSFRSKAEGKLREQIKEVYVDLRREYAYRRRKSAGYKLILIGGFCIGVSLFFILNGTYDIPVWMKIMFLAIGIPAWFLGINTLLAGIPTEVNTED